MKSIEWIAIVGALAWLPHLISVIKNYFTESEVRIITQKIAEIGFTTFGPIFNMRVAFSVKNRDLVISNFTIKVKHESGEEQLFEWQGIKQQLYKMTTIDGPIPYEKESSVLAIKLNQKEIEEKSIQCQAVSFIDRRKDLEDKAIKKLVFEKSQEHFDPMDFLKCQESKDMYNYTKHSFSWKAGNYKVVYEIKSPEKFTLVGNKYEFNLNSIDIEELEANKDKIEQDYINAFYSKEDEEYKEVSWNWKNPSITQIN